MAVLMKPLEAFTPKDIRTCARIIGLLESKGLDLGDLKAHAEHMAFMAGKGGSLIFRGVELTEHPGSVLEGLGWQTLRIWLKIAKIIDRAGLTLEEARAFMIQGRKKELNTDRFGHHAP